MANIKEFVLWFLQNFPVFLMTEPISLFVGFAVLGCVTNWIKQIINLT